MHQQCPDFRFFVLCSMSVNMLHQITGDGQSIGMAMFNSRKVGGLKTSPIKFSIRDSTFKKQVKALVSTMISLDPKDRPTVDEVLTELENIRGMGCSVIQ